MAGRLRGCLAAVADAPPLTVVSAAAAVAASVVALLSTGTWGVLAVALAVAAWQRRAAAVAVLAGVAVVVRLGTPSLTALSGSQAVLGPAVFAGPPAAAASAWLTGLALVLGAPGAWWRSVPFGLAGALVLAGPSAATAPGFAVRLLAAAGCVELAVAAPRLLPLAGRRHRWVAVVAAGSGAVLAAVARPNGWRWAFDGRDAATGILVVVAVGAAAAAVALIARHRVAETADA